MLIYTDDVYNGSEPEGDVEQVRSVIKGYIDRYAADKRIRIAGVPSPEYAAWDRKLAEANNGGGPMLQLEADTRGIPLADLVAKVVANATSFQQEEARIAGMAGKHRDALNGLTRDELLTYDWRF